VVLVDTRPREAKFTPDGKEVWVSSEVGGTVSVIDASEWKVKKKIRFEVPGVRPELLQPVGIEFTKDGKYVFAALGPGNRVAVIDPETYEVKQSASVPGISSSPPISRSSTSPTDSPTT
jgi:YVTN family beta-propeller protein